MREDLVSGRLALDENAARLALQLGHALGARAAGGLVGRDDDALDAEGLTQRLQRDHEDRRRAVRIGDEAVVADRVGIHLGHHQRHVGLQAEGGGVVHHRHALGGQRARMRLGEIARDGEQREIEMAGGLEAIGLDGNLAEGRNLFRAGATRRGEELELRHREAPLREHFHNFLTDRARGADHADPHVQDPFS